MILVDTSIWVNHLRTGNPGLQQLLLGCQIQTHPFVVGELALGFLKERTMILDALLNLPRVTLAENDEVLHFIETHRLFGRGIGYVDAHLLASTALSPGTRLWTEDRRLNSVAVALDLTWEGSRTV